ncbi:MAG: ferrous iron transport protein A [Firmicutes bacterium]|nr:ferrous iron transport protein A [Bacillota bacterium]
MREERPLCSLEQLRPGEGLHITAIQGEPVFRRRLYSLGFLPGVTVHVVRQMPARGPIEVEVHDVRMALRRRDAARIFGEPLSPTPPGASKEENP